MRVGLVDHGGIDHLVHDHALALVGGEVDHRVGGDHLDLPQARRAAAGRLRDAAAFRRHGLRLVEAIERAAAGISDQHDMLHAAPFQFGHTGGDVEDDLLMHRGGVVVGIARRGAEYGDPRLDQPRHDIVVLEIGARMHDDGGGLRPWHLPRRPQQAAMLAPVGRLEQEAFHGIIVRQTPHVERRAEPIGPGDEIHRRLPFWAPLWGETER